MRQYVFCGLLVIALVWTARPSWADEWYLMFSDEVYVTDFELRSGESREITIPASKDLMVGFRTEATQAQVVKYASHPKQIEMKQEGSDATCWGIQGAGLRFLPVNGEIRLKITNYLDESFKVATFKKKKK